MDVIEDEDNVWNFLQSKVTTVQSQTTSTSSSTALMKQYLNTPHVELKCDVITYWNDH